MAATAPRAGTGIDALSRGERLVTIFELGVSWGIKFIGTFGPRFLDGDSQYWVMWSLNTGAKFNLVPRIQEQNLILVLESRCNAKFILVPLGSRR